MRSALFVSIMLAAAACGDDGGSSPPIDAPPVDMAPVDMGGGTTLGQACSQQMPCPAATPICAILVQGQPGFCTLSCGSGAVPPMGMDPEPPANGTMTCMQGAMGSTGTPVCALTGAEQNGMIPWACGIACGTFMGQNLGTCPSNLTCSADNLCE